MERAAYIIATSLTGEEKALLLDLERLTAQLPDDYNETYRYLKDLRLIELIGGRPKVVVTLFGHEVLAQINQLDRRS